jgi:hypothetical protein
MGLPVWLMAAQTVSQAMGQHEQAKAQERAYKAQAQAAEQNAAIEAKKAEQVAEAYAQKQRSLTDKMRMVRGQARAYAGATGGTDGGSIADILGASQAEYEKDSLNLLRGQRNDTWSSYVNQVNYLNQQSAALTAAKNAKQEGRQKMFATILGGASSIYGATRGAGTETKNNYVSGTGWVNDDDYKSLMQNNGWTNTVYRIDMSKFKLDNSKTIRLGGW